MSAEKVREELVKYGKKIASRGLVVGPGGNISARFNDVMYISASGSSFEDGLPEDYVGVDIDTGQLVDGSKKPSSEVLMHLRCYQERPDIAAIVHTHPIYATAVASSGVELKPMFPDFAAYLDKVATLDYIIPTTSVLADAVGEVIPNYDAILLSNHGALTVGASLKEAFLRTELVEAAAKMFVAAKVLGNPRILSEVEVEAIRNLSSEKYRQSLWKTGSAEQ